MKMRYEEIIEILDRNKPSAQEIIDACEELR